MSTGGQEWSLAAGEYAAVVTEIGGGLRLLRHGTRDLVRGYAADQVRPRFAGVLLAPWPNRVVDGAYPFDGEDHQLALTEPDRGHALHGLAVWDRFEQVEASPASVTLVDRLVPQVGYPFEVEVQVSYTVDAATGLTTSVRARNTGRRPAPWGTAGHPYLKAGTELVDECTLTVPAAEVLDVTPDRLVPVGVSPVAGTALDFREPAPIGDRYVDHAFTGLRPDADGLVRVTLSSPSSPTSPSWGVRCTWDPAVLPWVQVHTADTPEPETNRTGLAVEPMTCPPDAFNSGRDLVVLPPGGEHVAEWTLSVL